MGIHHEIKRVAYTLKKQARLFNCSYEEAWEKYMLPAITDSVKYEEVIELLKDEANIDKGKMTKWLEQEIAGCEIRGESERVNALKELLLKVERGYFDIESA